MRKKQDVKTVILLLFMTVIMCGCSVLSSEKKGEPAVENKPLPKTRQLNKEEAVKAHLKAGVVSLENGDMTRAHRHLARALELDEKSAEVHNALAIFYQIEKDPVQEEKHFERALSLDSDNPSVNHNYGSFACRMGRYDEGRKHLVKAAANYRYPKRAETYENLGRCELLANNTAAAEAAFDNALRLNPKLPKSLLGQVSIKLDRGQNKLAYDYYQQFTQLSKQTAESLWLGIRLERIFGNKDALASYELTLRRLYPGSKEYQLYQASLKKLSPLP